MLQIMKKTNVFGAVQNSASSSSRISNFTKRFAVFTLLLLTFILGVRAAEYVFTYTNGNTTYFLGQSTTPTTSFVPNASIYTGNSGSTFRNANGYYIRYNNGLGINNTSGTNLTITNNNIAYVEEGWWSDTYYYLNIRRPNNNNRTWQMTETTDNLATAYTVTTSSIINNFTISGEATIKAVGAYNYTHNNATYYDIYKFNDKTYYSTNASQAATTTVPTNNLPSIDEGYTWTISSNSYATVNASTGAITVNSLPATETEVTLTCSVSRNGVTKTATKTITLQQSGNTPTSISASDFSLAVGTDDDISYTLTGTAPIYDKVEATSSNTGIFTVVTSPTSGGKVTLHPVAMGNATLTLIAKAKDGTANACSTTVNITVAERVKTPTIEYESNGAKALTTITCATEGATIYYTIDGSDPTTSSNRYESPFEVTEKTTVKAMAVKSGYINSSVASSTYEISRPTGVDGGVVTLNDLEDHTWTYYSGVDRTVDGGNYNDNYAGKLYSPNPRNVKITYNANGGAVSIDESETSFVYFKTLEQGATAGQYPYTVISNPFSKRPTGKGFGGWKIISGGEYINGYNNGSTLPLDQEITFVNLPYPSVNCISAEIVFEATWVNAKVTYLATVNNSNNNYTFNITNGSSTTTYENNFLVINRNYSGTLTLSQPVTIMMVEPNATGSDPDYRDNYTFTGNITPNNTGVTKIEYAKWNSTNTVNANFRNLWIGRGMTTTSQCASLITGLNTTQSTAGRKFSIKVESGKYDYFDFYKGHSTYIGGTANTNATITGTSANAIITIGNDYDRAQASTNNQNLEFKYGPMFGYQSNFSSRDNRDNSHTLDLTVKSGRIGYTFFMENTNTANYLQGGAGYCMYLSSAGAQTNVGRRNVLIEGGDICTIGSGIDSYNNAPSNNDTPDETINYNRLAFNVRIKGGTINGNVYGGAAQSPSGGNRVMVMTGGHVKGWFAAGCNGTGADGGQNYGTSWVYIGGTAKVDSEGSAKVLGYASGGNVYAAGAGRTGTTTCGEMTFGSNLVIADESYIERGAYGGGNYGYALSETNIYITGGTNEGKDGTVNDVTTKGGVFGGANQQNGPTINMYMTGGLMKGGVYGGCNTQGTISDDVTMQINGGQVGTSSQPANIHGGGYGKDTKVDGNVTLTLGSNTTDPGVTVYGDVYGGSALGTVNSDESDHTYVTMYKGTINGSLYGGGLGRASVAANVNGPVKVEVHGGSVKKTSVEGSGGVYGANNIYGAPQSSVTVDIYGTDPAPAEGQYALHAVYGGGNQANYLYGNGYPTVTIHGCDNSIEYVYGGGNAAAVAATDVTIWGGNVIGNVFGGGNGAVSAANVNGNATTKIYGGTILNVYGGSNSQGTIGGAINVTVNSQAENSGDSPCTMNIGDVYGGGNRAASNVGNLNIVCTGTDGYINRVFGGANAAEITGNIELEINGGNIGSVFGGNNSEQSISGDVTVNIGKAPNSCGVFEIGNVHGGGYGEATGVKGNVEVNIAGGTINGDVYGGSALGKVNTNTSNTTVVNLTGGIIHGDAYGGGLGARGIAADVNGNVTVTLDGTAFTLATTKDDEDNTIPTSGRVFGCNNINGSPKGTVLVQVFSTVAKNGDGTIKDKPTKNSGIYELQAVYGGGNLAAYYPEDPFADGQFSSYKLGENTFTHVNTDKPVQVVIDIDACDEASIEYVYGGGNAAATPATDVIVLGSYEIGNVFGGGNGKDKYKLDGGSTWYENPGADVGIIDAAAYKQNTDNGKYGTGKSKASVLGGTVHNLFGASNTKGNVVAESLAYVDNAGICTLDVGGIYGGGNEAYMDGDSKIELGCIEAMEEIYGGARNADVKGDINLTISSGHFDRVFGGNNIGGTINGSITVTIEETGCNPITIGELYGCGNQAPYTTPEGEDDPIINLISFTSIGNVFGGGFGEKAVVKGNPTVNINVTSIGANANRENWSYNGSTIDFGNDYKVTLPLHKAGEIGAIGTVYGGGNAAKVIGNTTVNMKNGIVENTLFGGGNAADVEGSTFVTIEKEDATINGNVFGGGNAADVEGSTSVTILEGTIGGNVYGGGNKGDVTGATKVQIGKQPTL